MKRQLPPEYALKLWHQQAGDEMQRVLAFANALAEFYVNPKQRVRVPIEELGLPTQHYNALRRAGFEWIDQLEGLSDRQLEMIKLIGPQGIALIRDGLRRVGCG